VSKGYPYEEDEFDAPVDPDGPHGVHRAPRSAWSKWWPFLVVIITVPALTFAGVYWAMQTESGGSGADVVGTDPDPDPSPDVTPTDDPGPEPVLTTQVMVINAESGEHGLAGKVADVLKEAGYATQNTPGNADKGGRTTDTVYYATEDLLATAEAVAALVGKTQRHPATVEQGLPTVEVPTGEDPPAIVVMLVTRPTPG